MSMKPTYEQLEAQVLELSVKLANVESKCAEVVAENAGLKNFISTDCFVAHVEPETFYEEEVTRYVNADGYEPETPATDAAIANIQAQGVEMMVEECESDIMLIEPEDEEFYTLMIEHAKEFAAQLRQGVEHE